MIDAAIVMMTRMLTRLSLLGELPADLLLALGHELVRENREAKTADFTIDQPKLLAHTGFFARFQGYRTILLFGLVHKVPGMRALHDMSVGVDDGIPILTVHGTPLRR